jgi:hypothetical protein
VTRGGQKVVDANAHRSVHRVEAGTHWTGLESLLVVSCPVKGRAVSTMENSWRTALLLV